MVKNLDCLSLTLCLSFDTSFFLSVCGIHTNTDCTYIYTFMYIHTTYAYLYSTISNRDLWKGTELQQHRQVKPCFLSLIKPALGLRLPCNSPDEKFHTLFDLCDLSWWWDSTGTVEMLEVHFFFFLFWYPHRILG